MNDIPHLAYSPDLAPCDFWLVPMIKKQLKGCQFKRIPKLQAAIVSILENIPQDDFEVAFDHLLTRWRKCVGASGEYFKGDGVVPWDIEDDNEAQSEDPTPDN